MPEPWPLLKRRISASALGKLAKCPEQFRRAYVQGQYGSDSAPTIMGDAAHYGIERDKESRAEGNGPLPLDQLERAVRSAVVAKIRKARRFDEKIDWRNESPSSCARRALGVATVYAQTVTPHYATLALEEQFSITVPGVPVPVVGQLDERALPVDPVTGEVVGAEVVIDRKTGAGAPAKALKPDWRLQAHIYLVAKRLDVEYHALSIGSPKEQSPYTVRSPRIPEQAPAKKPTKKEPNPVAPPPEFFPGLVLPATAETFTVGSNLIRSLVDLLLALSDRFGLDNPWPGALHHQFACSYCDFKDTDCYWWHSSGSLL